MSAQYTVCQADMATLEADLAAAAVQLDLAEAACATGDDEQEYEVLCLVIEKLCNLEENLPPFKMKLEERKKELEGGAKG